MTCKAAANSSRPRGSHGQQQAYGSTIAPAKRKASVPHRAEQQAMDNHFERLPENCLDLVLRKVRSDRPGDYRKMIRPVCKRFLAYVRANATKLTLDNPQACSSMLDGGFCFKAEYRGLNILEIDTRCFELARAVGLGAHSWKQLQINQVDEWAEDELEEGLFLLDQSKQSLRQLGFEVGLKSCDCGVSTAAWKEIGGYLRLLEEGSLELCVKNLSLCADEDIAGASVVRTLKLDVVGDLFALAAPYVFPNLEKLLIVDRDAPGGKDGDEAWGQILGKHTEEGALFGDPWPAMANLEELTYVAEHHEWAESETLAVETVQCIASQAPNLITAQLLGMLHATVARSALEDAVAYLCSLERLEVLTVEVVNGDKLGGSELSGLLPLLWKTSLKKLAVSGLSDGQAQLLKVEAKHGLRFETHI